MSDPPGVRLTLPSQVGLVETVIRQNACPTRLRTPTLAVKNVPLRLVRLGTASLLPQMLFPKDQLCDVPQFPENNTTLPALRKTGKISIRNSKFLAFTISQSRPFVSQSPNLLISFRQSPSLASCLPISSLTIS